MPNPGAVRELREQLKRKFTAGGITLLRGDAAQVRDLAAELLDTAEGVRQLASDLYYLEQEAARLPE